MLPLPLGLPLVGGAGGLGEVGDLVELGWGSVAGGLGRRFYPAAFTPLPL